MSGLFHWAGGKGRIVDALMSHIVPSARQPTPNWIEPFVGGGAVALEAMRRDFSRYVLTDGSSDVMSVFETLRDESAELMKELRDFAQLTEAVQRLVFAEQKPAYDQARRLHCARRLLILQACGFNGLYRVNKSGVYNVPFGTKVAKFNFDRLQAAAEMLHQRNVMLAARDFAATIEQAGPGDIVYADPPYLGTHSAYTSKGFDVTEHRRLAQTLRDAASRGAVCWVSGSDCDETRTVYGGVAHVIQVSRSISCKGSTRGTKTELLIRVGS
jgi:DNA adenine methylase